MMLAAAGLFRRLGTKIPPSQPTRLIATTGPYRWTRNPKCTVSISTDPAPRSSGPQRKDTS